MEVSVENRQISLPSGDKQYYDPPLVPIKILPSATIGEDLMMSSVWKLHSNFGSAEIWTSDLPVSAGLPR